jgi:hypothetical protein
MTGTAMTRRTVLASVASFAIAASFWGCVNSNEQEARSRRILLRMARRLYPHDALGDAVYVDVLAPLQAAADADPKLAEALRDGRDALDIAAGGDWLAADVEKQVMAFREIENGTFFETVQNAVRTELYEHPTVWELIGYQGSSVEHGGYLERGFDDIDWLPED